MNIKTKIIRYNDELERISEFQRNKGVRICLTTGCFDILHRGHVTLIEKARSMGELLFVGVNSDEAIRELKGPTRPIHTLEDRMFMLAALESVSLVFPIYSTRVDGAIRTVQPAMWIKGGDYTIDTLDSGEVAAARQCVTEIVLSPTVEGYSTTSILKRHNLL